MSAAAERRLAAILSADVAGCSRLISENDRIAAGDVHQNFHIFLVAGWCPRPGQVRRGRSRFTSDPWRSGRTPWDHRRGQFQLGRFTPLENARSRLVAAGDGP